MLSFVDAMGGTSEKPYFELGGKMYFSIYDPPHLLKSIRINLMKYNFEFGNKTAGWQDIKKFYDRGKKIPLEWHLNCQRSISVLMGLLK